MYQSQKHVEATDEARHQRAFAILLGTGLIMAFITIIFLITGLVQGWDAVTLGLPFAAGLTVVSFMGTALAKSGKVLLGVSLVLSVLYLIVFFVNLTLAGISAAIVATILAVTLGFTSSVLPASLVRRVNIFVVFMSILIILLDIFNPFPRLPDVTPVASASVTVVLTIVYGVLMVRQFNADSLGVRLVLVTVGVTALTAIIISGYFIYQVYRLTNGAIALGVFSSGLTILLVVFLLAASIAVYLGNSLTAPLISLTHTAQQVAAGDLAVRSDIKSNDEIGLLATAFNDMSIQLKNTLGSLEQRVADRTRALTTSLEISRRLSTILDSEKLFADVVTQVQKAFDYYHVHIYVIDKNSGDLVMTSGTGEAGRIMMERGHRIVKGKGLVGRAAEKNVAVLVSDVAADHQWLPNALLPETRSEIAVPISIGDQVLGVLDVQHNIAGSLTKEDAVLLESIANQVGIALQNARSYAEAKSKADREALVSAIGQKIQGTTSVESAMQVAIREIGRALDGTKTQIVLHEDVGAEDIVVQS